MLWYCGFTWQPGTAYEEVGRRMLELEATGNIPRDKIRGWYNLVGGGAGFLLLETDNPGEVTAALQPWMDLVSWDVRAVVETNLDETITRIRGVLDQRG